MTPPGARHPYAVLVTAVACVSTGAILVRFAEAPPLAVAFYRVLLASLILVPFAARPAFRAWPLLSNRMRWALLGSGAALAVHFGTWIASLSYTSVASSVLLVNTAPVFSVLLAWLLLDEWVRPVVAGAILLALCGAALIAVGEWQASATSLWGNLLALVGAITLAVYQVAGRGLRAALPLEAYVLAVWSVAAALLGAWSLAFGVALTGHPPRAAAAFVALAVIPTLLGHGLVNRSLRLLSAPTVGLFLLGEPVGATLMAWAAFGEVPSGWAAGGGAVILVSLALVVIGGRR